MAESFENLDDIIRDWAKEKIQTRIVEALNRYEDHKNFSQRIY